MTSWRSWHWLLACGAAAAFALASWLLLRDRRFDAEATLEYRPTAAGMSESSWQELLATERVILRSRSVCERSAARLIGRSGHAEGPLAGLDCEDVEVERVAAARVLRIRASHPDQKLVTQIVDSVAQAYLERHAEQTWDSSSSLATVVSELETQGQELDLLEQDAESYAREHGLLTYDAELEQSELGLLKQELTRSRIREITLTAELKQLDQAVQTKSYRAARFAADPAFREQRVGLAAQAAGATDAGAGESPPATQASELHARALTIVEAARAELDVLHEQQRELTEFLALQEDKLARRELDLVELRKRRRSVEEHQFLREALLQKPRATSSIPTFSVRILDHGHLVGRSLSAAAWLEGGPLVLLGLAGVAWFARRRLSA